MEIDPRQSKNKLSLEEIIKLYKDGVNQTKIADMCGLTPSAISQKIKKYGDETGEKTKRYSREEKQRETKEIIKLYEEGLTIAKIAKTFELAPSSVSQRIARYYEINGKEDPRKLARSISAEKRQERLVEIVNLYEQNVGISEIARRLRVSRKTISSKLRNYYDSQEKQDNKLDKKSKTADNPKKDEPKKVEREKTLDEELKEILMTGNTINTWGKAQNNENKTKKLFVRLERLRFIAEHGKRIGSEFRPDEDFLKVLDILKESNIRLPQEKYIRYISRYVFIGGICDRGKIDLITQNVFMDNKDLSAYILSGIDLKYREYDLKRWNGIKNNFEEKIDKYFELLHLIEDKNASKKQKDEREI